MPPIIPQPNGQLTLFSLTKICTGCKADKLHSEFYKNKNSLSGLCKPCHAAYSKAKYFANHEVNKAASREKANAKYQQDPEFHKEKSKQWRLNNLDKARESVRAYDRDNREKRQAYRKANATNVSSGGWQVGGGAESKIAGPLSVRSDFEYRFGPGDSLLVLISIMCAF